MRQLDTRGIPAEIRGEPPPPDPITGLAAPGGPYRVIVWSADEGKARAVMQELMPEPRDRLSYTH
jgi:hypothetical protein